MAGKNSRILVVDDSEITRFSVRSHLRQLGFYDVITASGANALDALREAKDCGLVLSEAAMEGTDGLTLLREIRQDPALGHVRFAMLTADTNPQAVSAAKAAGANGYIIRPYTLATLKVRLEALGIGGRSRAAGAPGPAA